MNNYINKNWFDEGLEFYCSDEYEKAMDCFIQGMESDERYIAFISWREAANALCYYNSQDKKLLINVCEKCKKLVQKYQRNTDILIGWGYAFYKLHVNDKKSDNDFEYLNEALDKYKKADEIEPYNAIVHLRIGDIYSRIAYEKKDESYFKMSFNEYRIAKKNIKENPKGSHDEFFNKYNDFLEKYPIAKELKKAVESGSNYARIYGSWSRTLIRLDKLKNRKILQEEFEYFENIENVDNPYVLLRKCVLALLLNQKDKAVKYFESSKIIILELLAIIYEENDEIIKNEEIFFPLLDSESFDGQFFYMNIRDRSISENDLIEYKKAYILSNIIIGKLHVPLKGRERFVSHYKEKTISQNMLINNSKFRLNSIHYSNDPTEGDVLIKYFYEKSKYSDKEKLESEYGVFAGCFTFSYDSLNQFRLYGKAKDKEEGVGLSLVFQNSFFCDEAKLMMSDEKFHEEEKIIDDEKFSLFRCIYIAPDEQQVITVGQKEEYLFYKEKNENEINRLFRLYGGRGKV